MFTVHRSMKKGQFVITVHRSMKKGQFMITVHRSMKKGQFMFPVHRSMINRSIHVSSAHNYEKFKWLKGLLLAKWSAIQAMTWILN